MNNSNDRDFLQSKKNLKWFESRIENFNNTVPHYISSLASHKTNILNQYRLENYTALKQERTSAERTIRHLKQLLIDTDKLREQVKDSDVNKFDKLVSCSRENISSALKNFNDLYSSLEIPPDYRGNRSALHYYQDQDVQDDEFQKQVLLHESEDDWSTRQQIEIQNSMEAIQKDVHAVNQIFHDLAGLVNTQKVHVDSLEGNMEETHENVVAAEKQLAQAAAKVKTASYPIVGALIGSCVGGPIGLVAGLKIGTAVAVTCSVIGFSGGKVLKIKQQRTQKQMLENVQEQQTVQL